MATTVTKVKKSERESALIAAANSGAKTLAGGLALPVGTHSFLVAEKDAFGILNVDSKASGKWALPIVAGTCTTKDGQKVIFEISDKPSAKTLVVTDQFYLAMQLNTVYAITVEMRNGQKRVTNVAIPAEVAEEQDAE